MGNDESKRNPSNLENEFYSGTNNNIISYRNTSRYRSENGGRHRHGGYVRRNRPPRFRGRSGECFNKTTCNFTVRDFLQHNIMCDEDEDVLKTSVNNKNLIQLHEKSKFFEKSEQSEPSEQFQTDLSDEAQNLINSNLQTICLCNKNNTNNKGNPQINCTVGKQSDVSSDVLSERSTSTNIDKITVEKNVSADFSKISDLNYLCEQKSSNSCMDNGDFKHDIFSGMPKELLDVLYREGLDNDNKHMSVEPLVLNEECQDILSKETENIIINSFKETNNWLDTVSKLPVQSVTSSIVYEIINMSQKLKLLLSFSTEVVRQDKAETFFPELSLNKTDKNEWLIQQYCDGEQQFSLHCNYCKTDIYRYNDVGTHINSKCCKNSENVVILEKNQDVVKESNQDVILPSLDLTPEKLREDKQYDVHGNFYCEACDNKEDQIVQSNAKCKINSNCMTQTGSNQSVTKPHNYKLLMKSISRNRKLGREPTTESVYYVCIPCDFVTGQQEEWKVHFKSSVHENKTTLLKDIKTYQCTICKMFLYCESGTINEHYKLPEHSEKVIMICLERQRIMSNAGVDYLGGINEDKCSDSQMKNELDKHEYFLKCLYKKRFSGIGPRGCYYCKSCNSYSYCGSKETHCGSKKHKEVIHSNPQLCKQFYCDSCGVYLYGGSEILSEHNAIKYHMLMDDTRLIQDVYNLSIKNYDESDNDELGSVLDADVKHNTEVNSQGNGIKSHEETISVLDVLENQSKSAIQTGNVTKNKTDHKNTEKDFSNSLKSLENIQNLLFISGCKMNAYFCTPCAVSVQEKTEWDFHIKSPLHYKKMCCKENEKLKDPKVCYICRAVFICNDNVFKSHICSVGHRGQLGFNEKSKDTIELQNSSNVVSEDENSDNASESEETEISDSDSALNVQDSETDDNMKGGNTEEEDNLIEEDNMEESDNLDEEGSLDEARNNVSCERTDDFTSDSYSVLSEKSPRQNLCGKEIQEKEQMKGKERKKVKRNETARKVNKEDKPKGLYITGLRQGTTHVHVLDDLKNNGHIVYVDFKYGEKNDALVIFKRGSHADKIVRDSVPLIINGCKVKAVGTIDAECLPCYEEDYTLPETVIKFLKSEKALYKFMNKQLKIIEDYRFDECLRAGHLINDIKEIFGWPVYQFGSRMTGIATASSDLDLYIDLAGKMYKGESNQGPDQQEALIELLSRQLFAQPKGIFSDIECITGARVPIIKLKHIPSGLNCDIQCLNGLSVENSKLISAYLQHDERVKWLIVAVKTWAREVKIADVTMFTTYALTWLVLFFLMQLQIPVVCSVSELRSKNTGPSLLIAGWDCTFCSNRDVITPLLNKESCIDLLYKFFDFYGKFPFKKYVLCPLIGRIVHRYVFKTVSELPPEFETYVAYINNNPRVCPLQTNTPMCLQDPFELSQNILKRVKGPAFKNFVTLCNQSAQLCEKWKRM